MSLGNNLYDNHNSPGNSFAFNGVGDMMGTPTRVVTSVADTFEHADDAFALSIREAIDLTSGTAGEEIWLPEWNFVLTRDRATYGNGSLTDMDVAFGDLDISDSLTIRGIAGQTSVAWRAGVIDAVFDLLGDFTGDGINSPDDGSVSGLDFLTWQSQAGSTGSPNDFSADANDDGKVNAVDLAILEANFGNTLDLFGIMA